MEANFVERVRGRGVRVRGGQGLGRQGRVQGGRGAIGEGEGRGHRGQGRPRGQIRRNRRTVTDEIRPTLVDHVINHGLSL